MPVATIELTSLGEFIDAVTPHEPDPRIGRRRDSGIYRGVGHVEHRLLTSLDRLGGEDPPHTKRELESHILRNSSATRAPSSTGGRTATGRCWSWRSITGSRRAFSTGPTRRSSPHTSRR